MKISQNATPEEVNEEIDAELARAAQIHQEQFASPMEAWGALREEYLEVEEEFRMSCSNDPAMNQALHKELIHLAAMCKKAILSCCTPNAEKKP